MATRKANALSGEPSRKRVQKTRRERFEAGCCIRCNEKKPADRMVLQLCLPCSKLAYERSERFKGRGTTGRVCTIPAIDIRPPPTFFERALERWQSSTVLQFGRWAQEHADTKDGWELLTEWRKERPVSEFENWLKGACGITEEESDITVVAPSYSFNLHAVRSSYG